MYGDKIRNMKKDKKDKKETHLSVDDFCCACEYDLAVMGSEIKKARKETREQIVRLLREALERPNPKGSIKNLIKVCS